MDKVVCDCVMETWAAGLFCLFIGIVAGILLTLMLAWSGHIKLEDVHIGFENNKKTN
jgi:hypothetical protein